MKTIHLYHFKRNINCCVIGIGKFDGFHKGHQKIVKKIVEISKEMKCIPSIFTFKNYPSSSVLSTWQEKLSAFKKSGIELCLWVDFIEIQKLSHEDFLENLNSLCQINAIVVGDNFRFGFHRKGDTEFLKLWGEKTGKQIFIVKPAKVNEKIVSSSLIKHLIEKSKFLEAKQMLGRWFSIKGRCIHGRGQGQKLGYPTINLDIENKNTPLTQGVYASFVRYKKSIYKSVVFYGKPLTFNIPASFEIHIPDIKIDNTYGKIFEVFPVKKIRDVKKFYNTDSLVEAIKNDIDMMKKIFSEIKFDVNKKIL